MEDTLIQQEFENLIEQLERLKKINELTATNEANARKVIDEMTFFVKSTSELKERMEKDHGLKTRQIEDVLKDLNNASLSFQKNVNDLSESLSDSNLSLQKDVRQDLNNLNHKIKDELAQTAELISSFRGSFTEKIKILKDELNLKLANNIKDLQHDLKTNTGEIISSVKSVQKLVSDDYLVVRAEQASTRKELSELLDQNFKTLRKENKKELNVLKALVGFLIAICIGLAIGLFT